MKGLWINQQKCLLFLRCINNIIHHHHHEKYEAPSNKINFFIIIVSCYRRQKLQRSLINGNEKLWILNSHDIVLKKGIETMGTEQVNLPNTTNLKGNQNKNNCLVSNFYDKLKSPAIFSHLFRTERSAANFNLL